MGILSWLFKPKKKQTTIEENARRAKRKYPLTKEGLFGVEGKGRTSRKGKKTTHKRAIYCEDQYETAQDFYEIIGKGGKETSLKNGHGVRSDLSDKTVITYRVNTGTKNSPAVSINVEKPKSKIQNQKIHFEGRKKK